MALLFIATYPDTFGGVVCLYPRSTDGRHIAQLGLRGVNLKTTRSIYSVWQIAYEANVPLVRRMYGTSRIEVNA
jgi:hypothetical protein